MSGRLEVMPMYYLSSGWASGLWLLASGFDANENTQGAGLAVVLYPQYNAEQSLQQ